MQNLRDLFKANLGRGLRELSDDDRLAAAWQVACGSALASRGELAGLDAERILQVTVVSREWMQPFLAMRSSLAADLGRIAGVRFRGIHFEVKRGQPRV